MSAWFNNFKDRIDKLQKTIEGNLNNDYENPKRDKELQNLIEKNNNLIKNLDHTKFY